MRRGKTKAQVILEEAKARLEDAQRILEQARINASNTQMQYNRMQDVVGVHLDNYEALKRSLAPRPRTLPLGKSQPPARAASAPSSPKPPKTRSARSSVTSEAGATSVSNKPERCGLCGNERDFLDHFQPSPHYHKFAEHCAGSIDDVPEIVGGKAVSA